MTLAERKIELVKLIFEIDDVSLLEEIEAILAESAKKREEKKENDANLQEKQD